MDKDLRKKPLSFIYLFVMALAFAAGIGALALVHKLMGSGTMTNMLGIVAFLLVCGALTLIGEQYFGPKWNEETQQWEK